MVGCAEHKEGDMGSCETEEGDWSAVGGDDSCKQTSGEKEEVAGTLDVDAEVAGVGFAQKYCVQRLHQQEGEEEANEAKSGEDGHLLHGDAVEVTHSPDKEALDVLDGGEEVEQGDDGGGDVAHHDTGDEQHEVVLQEGGEEEQERHDEERTDEGRTHNGEVAAPGVESGGDGTTECEHDDGDAEVGAGGDAEDGGAGKRIVEGGLEEKSGCGETRACQHGGDGGGESGAEDDVGDGTSTTLSEEGAENIGSINVDGAEEYIEDEENHNTQCQEEDAKFHFSRVNRPVHGLDFFNGLPEKGFSIFQSFIEVHGLLEMHLGMSNLDDIGEHSVGMEGGTLVEVGGAGVACPDVAASEGIELAIDGGLGGELGEGLGTVAVVAHQPEVGIVSLRQHLLGREGHGTALRVLREGRLRSGVGIELADGTVYAGLVPDASVELLGQDARLFLRCSDERGEAVVAGHQYVEHPVRLRLLAEEESVELHPLCPTQRGGLHVLGALDDGDAQLPQLVIARIALEGRHQHGIGLQLDDALLIGRHTVSAVHHSLRQPMNVLQLAHTANALLHAQLTDESAVNGRKYQRILQRNTDELNTRVSGKIIVSVCRNQQIGTQQALSPRILQFYLHTIAIAHHRDVLGILHGNGVAIPLEGKRIVASARHEDGGGNKHKRQKEAPVHIHYNIYKERLLLDVGVEHDRDRTCGSVLVLSNEIAGSIVLVGVGWQGVCWITRVRILLVGHDEDVASHRVNSNHARIEDIHGMPLRLGVGGWVVNPVIDSVTTGTEQSLAGVNLLTIGAHRRTVSHDRNLARRSDLADTASRLIPVFIVGAIVQAINIVADRQHLHRIGDGLILDLLHLRSGKIDLGDGWIRAIAVVRVGHIDGSVGKRQTVRIRTDGIGGLQLEVDGVDSSHDTIATVPAVAVASEIDLAVLTQSGTWATAINLAQQIGRADLLLHLHRVLVTYPDRCLSIHYHINSGAVVQDVVGRLADRLAVGLLKDVLHRPSVGVVDVADIAIDVSTLVTRTNNEQTI